MQNSNYATDTQTTLHWSTKSGWKLPVVEKIDALQRVWFVFGFFAPNFVSSILLSSSLQTVVNVYDFQGPFKRKG